MKQATLSESARVRPPQDQTSDDHRTHIAVPDVVYQRLAIVNVVYYGNPGASDGGWVLIDAGLPGTANLIKRAVADRFQKGSRPACIIMTHAHADHAGAL